MEKNLIIPVIHYLPWLLDDHWVFIKFIYINFLSVPW